MKAITTTAIASTEAYLEQLTKKLENVNSIEDFDMIDEVINELKEKIAIGELTQAKMSQILKTRLPNLVNGTLQGQALMKPYGYAGDFDIIDKIYTHHISNDSDKMIWDQYFQMTAAVDAVRNRKAYFKKLVTQLSKGKRQFSILNLASGPCRDIKELLDENGREINFEITCVDMDPRSIEYAHRVLGSHSEQIEFVNKNILRYTTSKQYDLVWSAGLFDYFDDKVFAHLLKRARSWVNPKGSLVIGNFNEDHNPSRPYMELFGEWYLNHRTESQLIDLAVKAGADLSDVSVGREESNVNLFLKIKF